MAQKKSTGGRRPKKRPLSRRRKSRNRDVADVALFHARLQSVPAENGTDSTTLIRTAVSDITDRKRTEEALKNSEEQFRLAIENAPIPAIMHAENGEVLQISRTWTELTDSVLFSLCRSNISSSCCCSLSPFSRRS